jgi:hypothetical protein
MNISTTEFDFNFHCSKEAGNFCTGKYVYHSVEAFNYIKIDNKEFVAIYQNGNCDLYLDCPSNTLELSEEASTDELLILINELDESDFEKHKEFVLETLEKAKNLCDSIDSVEKLYEVFVALRDNRPKLSDFLDLEKYTDDVNDYEFNEAGYAVCFKNKDEE